jgi:hypothetical protein
MTAVIAAPVLRAPSERVFGMEIVGRHHDPFTVMKQAGDRPRVGVYSQPVTDTAGALLARLSGVVAGYNWLVLITFPLAAIAAYLLARHLLLSPAGATVAALAFAFSPFHLAHAAYHPHIAQIQWIPLYLLALWRCLDQATPAAAVFLGLATMAVTLSNFYGGLIAAVITPVAAGAYWLVTRRAHPQPLRRLAVTAISLVLIAAAGLAYVLYAAGDVVANHSGFAFPRTDLFAYSAKWWSYLVPPVGHPVLGAVALQVWTASGVREGLLEQQVSLGWGIIALGLVAISVWMVRQRPPAPLLYVPVLVIVAVTALLCSMSPERTIGTFTFARPSALLYDIVPMFRSYARFGVVVQLMAALLAGIGVDRLRLAGTKPAQVAAIALVALGAAEYAVSPASLWRDVLPTTAHRWVTRQPGAVRVLDCTPLTQESESVQWMTEGRVTLLGGSFRDCTEPNLSLRLLSSGYTHLLVRRDGSDETTFANRPLPEGFRVAARFDDGQVFEVTAPRLPIYTATMTGFFPRERGAGWSWRWMGADAAWTIVNASTRPVVASLGLEMSAFHRSRRMELRLDGRPVQTLVVAPSRRIYRLGPLTIVPGNHELVFHPVEAPTIAGDVVDNGDRRLLSFAIGTGSWTVQGEQP